MFWIFAKTLKSRCLKRRKCLKGNDTLNASSALSACFFCATLRNDNQLVSPLAIILVWYVRSYSHGLKHHPRSSIKWLGLILRTFTASCFDMLLFLIVIYKLGETCWLCNRLLDNIHLIWDTFSFASFLYHRLFYFLIASWCADWCAYN